MSRNKSLSRAQEAAGRLYNLRFHDLSWFVWRFLLVLSKRINSQELERLGAITTSGTNYTMSRDTALQAPYNGHLTNRCSGSKLVDNGSLAGARIIHSLNETLTTRGSWRTTDQS